MAVVKGRISRADLAGRMIGLGLPFLDHLINFSFDDGTGLETRYSSYHVSLEKVILQAHPVRYMSVRRKNEAIRLRKIKIQPIDDELAGPNIGWEGRPRLAFLYGSIDLLTRRNTDIDMRKWGYCLWSEARFEKWQVLPGESDVIASISRSSSSMERYAELCKNYS
jgi:hypothetical protein